MAERTSLINHGSSNRIIIIREDYLSICDNDHCMAALLDYYEYEVNAIASIIEDKIANNPTYKKNTDDYFIHCTPKYLSKAMLGLFGRTKIIEANKKLLENGFITIKIIQEETKSFLPTMLSLNVSEVNISIENLKTLL